MKGVLIKKLTLYNDERGWLGEIIRDDESDLKPAMSYLSMTNPGLARGPHEHVEQTDYFCFVGKFRLYLWDNRKGSPTYGDKQIIDVDNEPTAAVVPPGVVHAYKNTGTEGGLVINLPDRLFMGHGKKEPVDEIRYEDDENSAFRIE